MPKPRENGGKPAENYAENTVRSKKLLLKITFLCGKIKEA